MGTLPYKSVVKLTWVLELFVIPNCLALDMQLQGMQDCFENMSRLMAAVRPCRSFRPGEELI